MSKIQQHFEKHKKAYTWGSIGVVVGVSATLVFSKTTSGNLAIQKVYALKTGDVTQNVIQQLARRGHPGNVIKCLETGETFASQNRAAAANFIDAGELSRHLAGYSEAVKGLHFEKIGEAVA